MAFKFAFMATYLVSAIIFVAIGQQYASVAPPAIETRPVLVASCSIGFKTELNETNVHIEQWPVRFGNISFASSIDQVEGQFILVRRRTGEPIILRDVVDRNTIPNVNIPPNHKVINIKTSFDSELHGDTLFEPGDPVDLYAKLPVDRTIPSDASSEEQPFLKSVRVFNVGSFNRRGSPNRINPRIMSLLLTEKQADLLKKKREQGCSFAPVQCENLAD